MARNNKVEAKNDDSVLVTEPGALGNKHLEKMKSDLLKGYKAHRLSKVNHNLNLREHRTAMIGLEKPIFGYSTKTIRTADGGEREETTVKQLFRAGWYLSVEEQNMVDTLLADPKTRTLNEELWATMEQAGKEVKKTPASVAEVRVVS